MKYVAHHGLYGSGDDMIPQCLLSVGFLCHQVPGPILKSASSLTSSCSSPSHYLAASSGLPYPGLLSIVSRLHLIVAPLFYAPSQSTLPYSYNLFALTFSFSTLLVVMLLSPPFILLLPHL